MYGALEKLPGGGQVAMLRQHKIKGFTATIDGAVKVIPVPFHFDVGRLLI